MEQVVAEVHHERVCAEELFRRQHGVGEPGRLILLNEADVYAELLAAADHLADLIAGLGRDDDPDLFDSGARHRVDPVEEHRAVGYRHQLLGAGEGDRLQARAFAAGEN